LEITGWDPAEWDESDSGTLGGARVTKQFSGDLEGTSVAEVLTAATSAGPAAYTAQERFTGSVGGRPGSFICYTGAFSVTEGSQCGDRRRIGKWGAGMSGTGDLETHADGSHHLASSTSSTSRPVDP